jgi:hypothetical protein
VEAKGNRNWKLSPVLCLFHSTRSRSLACLIKYIKELAQYFSQPFRFIYLFSFAFDVEREREEISKETFHAKRRMKRQDDKITGLGLEISSQDGETMSPFKCSFGDFCDLQPIFSFFCGLFFDDVPFYRFAFLRLSSAIKVISEKSPIFGVLHHPYAEQ